MVKLSTKFVLITQLVQKFVRSTVSGPGNRSTLKSAEYPKMEKRYLNGF